MSYYPPSENGAKVNMIKQKFEQNSSPVEKNPQRFVHETEDPKDSLRRSLSASPVKTKKNLKLNVSRQLSNPGKNIKRTPAFRGDKLSRTKNLQSPTKERLISIVNQNVKIFEEKPEYGKIGNVKKKSNDSTSEIAELSPIGRETNERRTRCNGWKDLGPTNSRDEKILENRVRTTVISRQKNISPIYKRDEEMTTTNGKMENFISRNEDSPLEKFFKNGAEYTKVTKASKPFFLDDPDAYSIDRGKSKTVDYDNSDSPDVREELSRRICGNASSSEEISSHQSQDVVDGDKGFLSNKDHRWKFKKTAKLPEAELTDTLKAALRAPLPIGPPPKKPPRTFAHSPIVHRSETKVPKNCDKSQDEEASPSEEDCSSEISRDARSESSEIPRDKMKNRSKPIAPIKSSISPSNDDKKRESRDSKKMLEKLEHVLIQHQKALGPKVIMPRRERNENLIKSDFEQLDKNFSSTSENEKREKRSFYNRLSRTLEDSKKFDSQTRVIQDSKTRKHSTFDCLPSLNCASSSVYEQVKNSNFTSYFNELSSLNDAKLSSSVSKSEDSIGTSLSNIIIGNSEFYEDAATSPADKRLSIELSSFVDVKKRQLTATKNEERVYAEPFAHDKNSGTDITGYGILTPEEHNYFSRNLRDERFSGCSENSKIRQNSSPDIRVVDKTGCSKPQLHYMCTSIEPLVYEDNNNVAEDDSGISKIQPVTGIRKNFSLDFDEPKERREPDKYDKIKVEQLLNQAFGKFTMAGAETPSDSNASSDTDSLASSASISDELSSFNEKLRLFKNRESATRPTKDELHRSLTEKRKNYVRRVSSKYSERRDSVIIPERRNKLFEVCLLVELNLSNREPYIKDKYPIYAKTPAWIENFCFPDATDWPPSDSSQNQFYSLALMDEKGNRRYGYCCRVRPEDGPILPLAYCLITKYRASGFYHKVLLELESRHGLPDKRRRSFIEELYNSPMPKPGQSLRMTNDENNRESSSCCTTPTDEKKRQLGNNNFILSKFLDSNEKIVNESRHRTAELTSALIDNEKTITERMIESLDDSDSMENVIMRSGDPRLEERDMSQLFDSVSNKLLIILFGSLLLERKVVLLCDKLGKLSSCVEALQSLLYPFNWPHTFIPVLPDIPGLSEILQAPLPFVIGILKSKNSAKTELSSIQDGIVVDLDTSKMVSAMGDESSILPSRLQKGIRSALQLVSSNTKSGDGIRNFLVSEAFLRVFVETCSHCDSHFVTQQDGKVIFQKESFVKASSSKTVQYFLEWFVETTMFTTYVQDCIDRMECSGSRERDDVKLFHQRIAEYRKGSDKSAQMKKGCTKKKTLGDRLKDLTNFHS